MFFADRSVCGDNGLVDMHAQHRSISYKNNHLMTVFKNNFVQVLKRNKKVYKIVGKCIGDFRGKTGNSIGMECDIFGKAIGGDEHRDTVEIFVYKK